MFYFSLDPSEDARFSTESGGDSIHARIVPRRGFRVTFSNGVSLEDCTGELIIYRGPRTSGLGVELRPLVDAIAAHQTKAGGLYSIRLSLAEDHFDRVLQLWFLQAPQTISVSASIEHAIAEAAVGGVLRYHGDTLTWDADQQRGLLVESYNIVFALASVQARAEESEKNLSG